MRVEVDIRPAVANNEAYREPIAYLRVYPDNNKDITDLMWIRDVFHVTQDTKVRISEIVLQEYHWVILFHTEKDDG